MMFLNHRVKKLYAVMQEGACLLFYYFLFVVCRLRTLIINRLVAAYSTYLPPSFQTTTTSFC